MCIVTLNIDVVPSFSNSNCSLKVFQSHIINLGFTTAKQMFAQRNDVIHHFFSTKLGKFPFLYFMNSELLRRMRINILISFCWNLKENMKFACLFSVDINNILSSIFVKQLNLILF